MENRCCVFTPTGLGVWFAFPRTGNCSTHWSCLEDKQIRETIFEREGRNKQSLGSNGNLCGFPQSMPRVDWGAINLMLLLMPPLPFSSSDTSCRNAPSSAGGCEMLLGKGAFWQRGVRRFCRCGLPLRQEQWLFIPDREDNCSPCPWVTRPILDTVWHAAATSRTLESWLQQAEEQPWPHFQIWTYLFATGGTKDDWAQGSPPCFGAHVSSIKYHTSTSCVSIFYHILYAARNIRE